MRNQRGITLIALVITIIVLLILAGMLTGDNGILTKATESSVETEKAEISEKVNMAIQAAYANAVIADTADPSLTVGAIADQYESDNNLAADTVTPTEPTGDSGDTANGKLKYTSGTKTYTITLRATNNSFITSSSDVAITE